MVYVELQSYGVANGPNVMLCYVNDVTSGLFMSVFFLTVWLIMCFASFFMQKKLNGSGDIPVSMSLASFTTFITSVFFRLVSCPYDPLTSDINLAVIIGITLLSVIFLFFSKDN